MMQGVKSGCYIGRSMLPGRNRLNTENLCGAIGLSDSRGLASAFYAEGAVAGWGVMRSAETHVKRIKVSNGISR